MASDGSGTITYEQSSGIAIVTLNRPERRNAMTPEMQASYFQALLDADADRDVRAVVVTGAGTAFCAGADFERLDELTTDPAARGSIGEGPLPRYLPLTLGIPIIAAVNGPAVGLGFVFAVFSDIRFAASSATFSAPFARLGLIAEYGLSWILPRLIGIGNASDLLLSGRTVDAAEASQIGIVQRVVADEEVLPAAVAYAQELADRCSPRSLAVIKKQILNDHDRQFRASFDDALGRMVQAFATPDVAEGVAAFRERRLPVFPPYDRRGDAC